MWPARPARERKKRLRVTQGTVGAISVAGAARAWRVDLLLCATDVRLFSAERAPEETTLRQAGRSEARACHGS